MLKRVGYLGAGALSLFLYAGCGPRPGIVTKDFSGEVSGKKFSSQVARKGSEVVSYWFSMADSQYRGIRMTSCNKTGNKTPDVCKFYVSCYYSNETGVKPERLKEPGNCGSEIDLDGIKSRIPEMLEQNERNGTRHYSPSP